MKLEGKSAIVTSGGRGVGREIALALAREGADILVSGRHREALDETAAMIEQLGRRSIAVVTDVSDESQVGEMVNAALECFGKVDILINNTGITTPDDMTGLAVEEIDNLKATTLTGAFLCAKAVIPQMLEKGSGKIINIGSEAGELDDSNRIHNAANWGMLDFSETLAEELGPYNIQVNAICPGSSLKDRGAGRTSESRAEEKFIPGTVLNRMLNPQQIAEAVVFFCSPEGDSISGETLEITVGYAL